MDDEEELEAIEENNNIEESLVKSHDEVTGPDSSKTKENIEGMEDYMDILNLLNRNRDKLEKLLEPTNSTDKLPNYAFPGRNTTKTFGISSILSSLVEEYSEAKEVSQKEMLQIAMVDFLINYGYREEIQILLNRK